MLCSNCQQEAPKLYQVPDQDRLSPHAPTAVCHFCFVRLVKRRPSKGDLIPRQGGPGQT